MTNTNDNDADERATSETMAFSGSIGSLDIATQNQLNTYLVKTEGDPNKKTTRRNLVRMASILEGSSQMSLAQKYTLEEHRPVATEIGIWRASRKEKGNLPPQNAEELEDFEKKNKGKSADAMAYKQDYELADSAEKSLKRLNRKLTGGPAITDENGVEIEPAEKGMIAHLNEAEMDSTPAGRQKEAEIIGEMMTMALPAAGFVQERLRIHGDGIKIREQTNKRKKDEAELEVLEARLVTSGYKDLLTKARTYNEENRMEVWEQKNMLSWMSNPENIEKLSDLKGPELIKAQDALVLEWNAGREAQRKFDRINPDGESDDSQDDYK